MRTRSHLPGRWQAVGTEAGLRVPSLLGGHPAADSKDQMFIFTAMLRLSRTLTSLTRRLVCVPWSKNTHHSRVAAARGRSSGVSVAAPTERRPAQPVAGLRRFLVSF